jgi:hypothetical protein
MADIKKGTPRQVNKPAYTKTKSNVLDAFSLPNDEFERRSSTLLKIVKAANDTAKKTEANLKTETTLIKKQDIVEDKKSKNISNQEYSHKKLGKSEAMGRGTDGSLLSKISSAYKGADNPEYAKTMSNTGRAAATVMGQLIGSSATVGNALGLLSGAITPTTAAFKVLEWAVGEAIESFVEGFTLMQGIRKTAAHQTQFTNTDAFMLSKQYIAAAGLLNAGVADAMKSFTDSAKEMVGGISGSVDMFETVMGANMQGWVGITRITTNEALTVFNDVLKNFKDFDIVSNMEFAKLAVGLNELGYRINGPLGEFMKNQFYRDTQQATQLSKMDRTNEILNNLLGLSKSSTLSLDELVSIMNQTQEQQNLTAYTLMRSGMGMERATQLSTSYGVSRSVAGAAADTLGLSSSGVDSIFNMFNDIIASATDPTRLGDLTRKYQVGGMTGGKSINEIYQRLITGDFIGVFRDVIMSTQDTAADKSGLGFEYLSSQFGSNITTVLGAFTPTVITKLLATVDDMYFDISKNGMQNNNMLGEVQKTILNAPVTMEDILNSLFDKFVQVGHTLSSMLGVFKDVDNFFRNTLGSVFTGLAKFFGISVPDSSSNEDGSAADGINLNPGGNGISWANNTISIPGTEGPGGIAERINVSDYFAVGDGNWTSNTDMKGSAPFRLTAGFQAPAYLKRFGRHHNGVDYAAPIGTQLPSTVAGEVVGVGSDSVSGNYVKVRDDAGRIHLFAHMQNVRVKRGDRVGQGTVLGTVGSTGRSTGPHVHYGVKENNSWINPNAWAGSTFGGLPGNYSGMGADGNVTMHSQPHEPAIATTASNMAYYDTNSVVDAITDLNIMLSNKLDIIINKMSVNNMQNQFSYR